jgi:hypothetical protein
MCISYFDLNQLRVFLSIHGCFLLVWHFGPHLHHLDCFCKSFGKIFSNSFANIQWYKNMISKGIFKFLKILPMFQMLFLWLNKSSPWRNSPLSYQEGFCNLNDFSPLFANFSPFRKKFLEHRLVVRSFCFGPIISPPLAISAENEETLEAYYFLPLCKKNMNESSWGWQRINDTDRVIVEALPLPWTPFPFQSKTKDRNILGSTLVLALAQEE